MPLHLLKPLPSGSLLGLWRAEETVEQLQAQLLSLRPGHQIPAFKAESRTHEWLAARVLAYTLLDQLQAPSVTLETLETGEPVCSDQRWQVSLTHSGAWVGALVSSSHKVGIDLELKGEKVPKLAHRFLNENELASAAGHPDKLHLYWSAKETLYKVYRQKKLFFRENLVLENFALQPAGTFGGQISTPDFAQQYQIHYENYPEYVLTYVLAPAQVTLEP
ncbi:4'-phosphopantetheinyl transferase superfamily protein [Rufibacter immobilis]|uniref:4'-phosphopantetheinyl transferase superfamily protein n=1 Tax=Rufibacter immobilis TaxID=1348778 RepID=UPI0035EF354E